MIPHGQGAPTTAGAIVTALADAGTEVLFGLPGGGPNLDVVQAAKAAGMRFVLTHTETAAVIMAATYADLTGRPGAAVVTRGPGLASAINGIAHAALDKLPVVVIADTVREADKARITHQRLDQAALGHAVAKSVVTMGRDQKAPGAAAQAVSLARTNPAGPVIALMDDSAPTSPPSAKSHHAPHTNHDAPVLEQALRASRRPLIMLGTNAIPHTPAIRQALKDRGIPALHTYRARGIIPDDTPEAAGLITGGTMEWPLLAAADLIIGLGVDEAELIPATWDYKAPVLLVTQEEPAYFPGAVHLSTELPQAITVLVNTPADHDWPPDVGRRTRTRTTRRLTEASPGKTDKTLSPAQVVTTAREHVPPDTIVTVDAGAHMLAVMPLWEVTEPHRLLISSGLATMGYALPAAIAAALHAPDRPIVAFTGDGGLAMTLAEIETAARLSLRITVVVFNDSTLSLIKIKQRQDAPEAVDFAPVDYARAAQALGAAAVTVTTEPDLAAALNEAANHNGPTVIDVNVDPAAYPAIMELTRGEPGRHPIPGL